MANEQIDPRQEFQLMERAERKKFHKFSWSGLIIALAGLVILSFALTLRMGAYSIEGLLGGLGIILIIVGIIRILIALINPATPEDIKPPSIETVEEHLFEDTGNR